MRFGLVVIAFSARRQSIGQNAAGDRLAHVHCAAGFSASAGAL